ELGRGGSARVEPLYLRLKVADRAAARHGIAQCDPAVEAEDLTERLERHVARRGATVELGAAQAPLHDVGGVVDIDLSSLDPLEYEFNLAGVALACGVVLEHGLAADRGRPVVPVDAAGDADRLAIARAANETSLVVL